MRGFLDMVGLAALLGRIACVPSPRHVDSLSLAHPRLPGIAGLDRRWGRQLASHDVLGAGLFIDTLDLGHVFRRLGIGGNEDVPRGKPSPVPFRFDLGNSYADEGPHNASGPRTDRAPAQDWP